MLWNKYIFPFQRLQPDIVRIPLDKLTPNVRDFGLAWDGYSTSVSLHDIHVSPLNYNLGTLIDKIEQQQQQQQPEQQLMWNICG